MISIRTPQASGATSFGVAIEKKTGCSEDELTAKVKVQSSRRNSIGFVSLSLQATDGLPAYIGAGQERLVRTGAV